MNGHTYSEIQNILGRTIPKGSMSYICKDIQLTAQHQKRINNESMERLANNRVKALAANRKIFEDKIMGFREVNAHFSDIMQDRNAQIIALAMLYLGEGAKWQGRRGLMLGSTSSSIINLYINLLQACYDIPLSKLRGRIQHRADQDPEILLTFWSQSTGIPRSHFYKCYVDKRTIGHVTRKQNYKGVCSISGGSTNIQLELDQIAGIISDALRGYGAVGSAFVWHTKGRRFDPG